MKNLIHIYDASPDVAAAVERIVRRAGVLATHIAMQRTEAGTRILVDPEAKDTVEATLADTSGLDAEMLPDSKRALLANLRSEFGAKIAAGYTMTLPGGGEAILQIGQTDIANLLVAKALYQTQINAGNGEVEGARIRALDNVRHRMTFVEADAIIAAAAAHGAMLQNAYWDHKDAIDAATSTVDLDAIEIAAGWP